MVRALALSLVLSCLATTSWAQSQPGPGVTSKQGATTATKPELKRQPAKPKPAAKPADSVAENASSRPCRFGVIPVVGDRLYITTIGFTVFGNERAETSIDSWAVDDLIVARVRAAAGSGGTVRRIPYAEGAFQPFDNPKPGLFRAPENDLGAIVRQVAANSNCQLYVVVTKRYAPFNGTNQHVRGVSVVRQGLGELLKRTYIVTNIHITVFDGQSFAARPITMEQVFGRMFSPPQRVVDNTLFPEAPAAAASNAKLRADARSLIAETLDKALPTLLAQ